MRGEGTRRCAVGSRNMPQKNAQGIVLQIKRMENVNPPSPLFPPAGKSITRQPIRFVSIRQYFRRARYLSLDQESKRVSKEKYRLLATSAPTSAYDVSIHLFCTCAYCFLFFFFVTLDNTIWSWKCFVNCVKLEGILIQPMRIAAVWGTCCSDKKRIAVLPQYTNTRTFDVFVTCLIVTQLAADSWCICTICYSTEGGKMDQE